MITHHTALLQALIDKHGLQSYLEIGVQNPANNFDKIRCEYKLGIDPEIKTSDGSNVGYTLLKITSDSFFETNIFLKQNSDYKTDFDLIFIDGWHTAEQVKRDFENSLRCLSDNGFIVLHDCLPKDEATTKVPRSSRVWHGDVYKFAMRMCQYKNVSFITYNIDEGCMVVRKTTDRVNLQNAIPATIDWNTYKTYGRTLLNVVDEVII